jgi:glycosyltransferase involved in cell wall biosynthesis
MQTPMVTDLGLSDDYVGNLVSVVIVTYNQVDYVGETLESVLAQDYQELQIIVSDDGSTDGTAQLIEKYAVRYPNKIVAVLSKKNTGISANFNRALTRVRGEYIAWLGGDDVMLPTKISKQVELMQRRLDVVGCCHDAELFESPSGKVLGVFSKLINGKQGFKEGGVELWFDTSYLMLPSTMLIRATALPKHGFDERLRYLNDWLLDVEIFRNGSCAAINEVLVKYRRHANNVSGNAEARALGDEEKMIALGIIEARYPELYYLVKQRKQKVFLAAAVASFGKGDMKRAMDFLKAAARLGAVARCAVFLVAMAIFGNYIARQMALVRYERSRLFIFISKYI